MKNSARILYRSTLHDLLQDNSLFLESLIRSFGLLYFSVVAKYAQENMESCTVELYEGGYVKLLPERGIPLEAYKQNSVCYFQYISREANAGYCIRYTGRARVLPKTREVIPLDPTGTIYFKEFHEAKAFYDSLNLNAILLQQGTSQQKLFSKVKADEDFSKGTLHGKSI